MRRLNILVVMLLATGEARAQQRAMPRIPRRPTTPMSDVRWTRFRACWSEHYTMEKHVRCVRSALELDGATSHVPAPTSTEPPPQGLDDLLREIETMPPRR